MVTKPLKRQCQNWFSKFHSDDFQLRSKNDLVIKLKLITNALQSALQNTK